MPDPVVPGGSGGTAIKPLQLIPWPSPTPPVPGPAETVGSGQKVREEVCVAQGRRVPVLYGGAKIGYDIVYLNAEEGSVDISGGRVDYMLTAVGVFSEGPVQGVSHYVTPSGVSHTFDDIGDDLPLYDLYVLRNGAPDINPTGAVSSGDTTTAWKYRVALAYQGAAMPFGMFAEITIMGHATVPNNRLTWDLPIDENLDPLCFGVIIWRTESPNPGSYPVGCLGAVNYGHTNDPSVNTFDDVALPIVTFLVPTMPTTAPCSLMPNTAFVVMSWYRYALSGPVEFPRLLAQGRLLADPREARSVSLSSGSEDVALNSGNTSALLPGMAVYGDGIPDGTHILSITDSTNFKLTADATITDATTDIFIAEHYTLNGIGSNPALQLLDMKLSVQYGDGVPWADIDTASVVTAADWCDEVIAGEGSRKNHTSNIFIREVKASEEWQKTIGLAAGLRWKFSAGQWSMTREKTGTSVRTLTADDLVECPTLRRTAFMGLRDLPNRVTVEWTDSSTNGAWRVRTISAQATEVDSGAEVREGSNYLFHGITNEMEAYAAAWRVLNSMTLDLTIAAKLMPEHQDLAVGDVVAVTYSPLGLSATTFRIMGLDRNDDDTLTMSATEYADGIYSYAAATSVTLAAWTTAPAFADDFENTAARDWITVDGPTTTGSTRTTTTYRTPGFEYTLPQATLAAYGGIVAYAFVGETVSAKTWDELVAGYNAGTAGYYRAFFPSAEGDPPEPEAWDPDITAAYYAISGVGGVHRTVAVVETLGTGGEVVSTETTTTDYAKTVRWKLVNAALEVSSAAGYLYFLAADDVDVVTTGVAVPGPITSLTLVSDGASSYLPSIWWTKADNAYAGDFLQASYSGTGNCTVTGDYGETTWATPYAGTLVLDAGVGNTHRFKGLRISARTSGTGGTFVVSYSSNGSAWTDVTGLTETMDPNTIHYPGGMFVHASEYTYLLEWTDPGAAYRYWRIQITGGTETFSSTSRLRWMLMTEDDTQAVEYVIRQCSSILLVNAEESAPIAIIPIANIPTAAAPLDLMPWVRMEQHDASDTPPLSSVFTCWYVGVTIRGRNANGDEGWPVAMFYQWYGGEPYPAFATLAHATTAAVPDKVAEGSLAMDGAIVSTSRLEAPTVRLNEDPVVGTDYIDLKAPASVPTSYTLTLPSAAPAANQVPKFAADGTSTWQTYLVTDGSAISLTAIAAPGAPTVAATVAGSKPAGTWNYKATWVTATGESPLSVVSSNIAVDGTKAVTVTRPASPPTLATGWRVYSSKLGPTSSWWVTSGTIAIGTTTYNDNAADAALTVEATYLSASAGRTITVGSTRSAVLGATNVALGANALTATPTASGAVAVGTSACGAITSGNAQTGIGYAAMVSATTAGSCTAVGYQAGYGVTTGSTNTIVGVNAGYSTGASFSTANALTTGGTNTFLGANAGLGSSTQRSNATAVGYGAYVDADNTVVLGNASVTDVYASADKGATMHAGKFQLAALNTAPASAGATGTLGEIRIVNGYIYVCVATDTWQRVAIATW